MAVVLVVLTGNIMGQKAHLFDLVLDFESLALHALHLLRKRQFQSEGGGGGGRTYENVVHDFVIYSGIKRRPANGAIWKSGVN